MQKSILSFVVIMWSVTVYGQIPTGYYDNADELSGSALKAALNDIIDGHIEYPYTSSSTDVWDLLKIADRDPNNPDNVLCIYSGFSIPADIEYDGGNGWSREHVWAKSRGDFGTDPGAGTDLHHLRAADISTNSARTNRAFAECSEPYIDVAGTYNGATAAFTTSTDFVWMPPANVKGDVARMIFYMATRYEGEHGEPDLELTEDILENTDKSPVHGKLSDLLKWHSEDPVDDVERNRNEIVFGFQGNRNPYIDHPEWVAEIWGEGVPDDEPIDERIVANGRSLFFSEYIEGSSFNKAIEIYNPTGYSVNMGEYEMRRYSNGATEPTRTLALSGKLNENEVFVIAHPSADVLVLNEADITNDVVNFNGNDAIGLFKGEELIDVFGVIGNDPGTAWENNGVSTVNKTLVRKAVVDFGNSKGFDPISQLSEEWNVFVQDEFSMLGSHFFEPSIIYWDGSLDSDWNEPSNWNSGNEPTSSSSVVIPVALKWPLINGDAAVNDLQIEAETRITVSSGSSLAIMGTATGEGEVTIRRKTNGSEGYSIVGTPVNDIDLEALQAQYLYSYNELDGSWSIPSGSMNPGTGYFVGYDETDPEISLTGSPFSGTREVTISKNGGGFNLVANPYLAPISISDLLNNANNSTITTGSVYFWDDGGLNVGDDRGGDYVTVNSVGVVGLNNLSDGVTGEKGNIGANTGNIGSMQGFFVQATGGGNLAFSPDMQVLSPGANADENYYRKSEDGKVKIKLGLSGNGLYNETIIGFLPNATTGLDYSMDAEKFSGNELISLYSLIDEKRFAIQGLPSDVQDQHVKLGLDIGLPGMYELSVIEINGEIGVGNLILVDKENGELIELNENAKIELYSPSGVDARRFEIVYMPEKILSLGRLNAGLSINYLNGEMTIESEGDGLKDVEIYSLDGREVFSDRVQFFDGKAAIKPILKRGLVYVLRVDEERLKFGVK